MLSDVGRGNSSKLRQEIIINILQSVSSTHYNGWDATVSRNIVSITPYNGWCATLSHNVVSITPYNGWDATLLHNVVSSTPHSSRVGIEQSVWPA